MINTVASNYDIIFCAVIVLSTVVALFRGAVSEILSLVTWVMSFWLVTNYGAFIRKFLPQVIPNNLLLRQILIFTLLFIIIAILAKIVKIILANLITGLGLTGLNYTLGILFGLARGIFLCSALIIVIGMFRLDPNKSYQKAKGYSFLKPCITWIASSIPRTVSI